tara:strand:- start:21663 stop:21893 length:231 start_codon:yes stop_codon:yes gene_type:complete
MYDRGLEIMILMGVALVSLPFIIAAYRNRHEPTPWEQQANGPAKMRVVKRARGYDPVLIERGEYNVKTVDLGRLRK